MPYQYVVNKPDYADYASGCVFYGAPGHPAFPIRLASEIYQACYAERAKGGLTGPCLLYDPVCGGAYHLSVLAYLHRETIHTVIGSDIDNEILMTAERNLGLLSLEGMDKRIQEIESLVDTYGKNSHISALTSAYRLRNDLMKRTGPHNIHTDVFCADALDSSTLKIQLGDVTADIVIADIPYGIRSSWQIADTSILNPTTQMLNSLLPILSKGAIVAIATGKGVKISHPVYHRVQRFKIGKRQVVLLVQNEDT